MSAWEVIGLACALFAAGLSVDFAGTRHQQYVAARRRWRAAFWTIAGWCCAMVGFVVGVKCSLWLLPAEAAGLGAGTLLAIGRPPQLPRAELVSRRRWRERGS